jgi:hypothetical protein
VGLENRLQKLEDVARPEVEEDGRDRDKWRAHIRHAAESSNRSREREGLEPIFEIAEDGTVYTFDGRLVDDFHQSGAEHFYWQASAWGDPGLVHDEKAVAFFAHSGELVVSRERFDLQHLLNH